MMTPCFMFIVYQVYQKAEDGDKAAHYCQVTLRRQLEMKAYDPVSWALNAATLSQYYVTENNFSLSRHCLGRPMSQVTIIMTSILNTVLMNYESFSVSVFGGDSISL